MRFNKSFVKIIILALASVLVITPLTVDANPNNIKLSLMYNFGGCDTEYYTPEAYYVAPIVKDIDKDGKKEIIFGNYSVIVVDAITGKIKWRVNGGLDRSKPFKEGNDIGMLNKIVVADIDGDGYDEIVCAHVKGTVSVLSYDGYMKPGWPKQLVGRDGKAITARARSVVVSDLDNDGKYEVIVGASTTSPENVWVYKYNGELMEGWPQLSPDQDALKTNRIDSGYSYGVFMDGVTSGDIYGDDKKEIIVTTDTGYICAYDIKGKLIPANPSIFQGRTWGKVALWEDVKTETNMNFNEGWGWSIIGGESRSELYKGELGHAVVKVYDVNNDGKNEVVTSAIVLDRAKDTNSKTGDFVSSKYMSLFIFNGDRTRFKGWEKSPSDRDFMGVPLVQDPGTLSSHVQAEPVIADLNNDGINEVLINTYDGKVHAFSVNDSSKEFKRFPYVITQPNGDTETPNGVICLDINNDGNKEVIFTTYTRTRSGSGEPINKGKVYILNSEGSLLVSGDLPDSYRIYETQKPAFANVSLAAPAVSDIDNDGNYEIIINTKFSGICVFKLTLS